MQEVAALCDRIVILGQGRVVAEGTAAELIAQIGRGVARGRVRRAARHRRGAAFERSPLTRGASRILTVARKEIVDTLRDRRTLLVTLVTAALAGPIFLLLIFNLFAQQADRARELELPCAAPSTPAR